MELNGVATGDAGTGGAVVSLLHDVVAGDASVPESSLAATVNTCVPSTSVV
jgi:hypothetical protein